MATALAVYAANAASSTLSTANQLYANSAGSPTNVATYSNFGTGTGYIEIAAQGQVGTCVGSIGSPSGKGFLYDVTSLEGKQLIAGSYSANIRLNASQFVQASGTGLTQAGTLTADISIRVYIRSSGGTYTQICQMVNSSQSITSVFTTYGTGGSTPNSGSFTTSTSIASPVFQTGDKLYVDIWANVTANANANANQGIRLNRLSTDTSTFVGDASTSVTTPGYATAVLKDLSSRFRLQVTQLKDLSARLRVQATSLRDVATRLVLSGGTQRLRDLSARLRVQATSLKDLSSRTRIAVQQLRDLSVRLFLSGLPLKDTSLRMRLLATRSRDLSARFLLFLVRVRDLSTRLRLQAAPLKDTPARIKLLAQRVRDLSGRFRLQVQRLRDLSARIRFIVGHTFDISARFHLTAPQIVLPATAITAYRGIPAALPIPIPTLPYLFAGVTLDTPIICTGPPLYGGILPSSATFTLLFQSPSISTQNALTLGVIGLMQLFLADSSTITAPVQVIATLLTGSLFQVTFQVTATTPLWQYVTITQFF